MRKIIKGDDKWRTYKTPADRNRAIAALGRRGWNYFVCYLDVQGLALYFSTAAWVGPGSRYVNW